MSSSLNNSPTPQSTNDFQSLRQIIAFLKTIHLPKQKDVPVYKLIISLYRQIKKIGIAERASILSFNIMMAIPPSLMFIFAITPYLPFLSDKFHKEILFVLKELAPDKGTYQNLSLIINDLFYKPKNAIYSLSFFLFLFFASNATLVMMKTFDKSIEQRNRRHFIASRMIAVGITLSLFAIFIALIALLNIEKYWVIHTIKKFNLTSLKAKNIISTLRNVFSCGFLFLTIAFVYKFTPIANKRWKFWSFGAVFASLAMLLMVVIFNFWATNFLTYNKTYGPLGTLIFVMTLIYIFSFVLLIGFEVNLCIDFVKATEKAKGELKT